MRILIVAALALVSSLAWAEPTVISESETSFGNLVRTDTVVSVGEHPADRFTMHRVRLAETSEATRGVVVLVPPLQSNFDLYEYDEAGDYRKSLAGTLATANVDVWGYSGRSRNLLAGQCESGAVDCAVAATWGLGAIQADVAYIRVAIEATHPGAPVAIGGVSLGAMTAIVAANAAPDDYDGLILNDGALVLEDPQALALNAQFCADLNQLMQLGIYWDGQSFLAVKLMAFLFQSAPGEPSPFVPGLTNRQAFYAFVTAPPLQPAAPFPGFQIVAGSLAEGFTISDDTRVAETIQLFDDYGITAVLRDVSCSLAGDATYTGNLGAYAGHVYIYGAGHAFGPHLQAQANAFTSAASVELEVEPDFGHMDHLLAPEHRQLTDFPILEWLSRKIFPPGG